MSSNGLRENDRKHNDRLESSVFKSGSLAAAQHYTKSDDDDFFLQNFHLIMAIPGNLRCQASQKTVYLFIPSSCNLFRDKRLICQQFYLGFPCLSIYAITGESGTKKVLGLP